MSKEHIQYICAKLSELQNYCMVNDIHTIKAYDEGKDIYTIVGDAMEEVGEILEE